MNPDRRTVLRTAALTAGAALAPWTAIAEASVADASRSVFGFGVASGDPTADAVVLWTRVTPSPAATPGSGKGGPVAVTWQVARDPSFRHVWRTGTVTATAQRDHTVHVDVTGLPAYSRFYYRFRALGQTSATGRAQTAPDVPGKTHALRLAFASCANWTGGWFTPYRHLAARDDLDAVLFLGDYLYEYGNGDDRYGPSELSGTRDHEPAGEMVKLADYRKRHALYKTDPDLQAAHRQHSWIMTFDDHEVCDNTWARGAVNHQPEDGAFATRKRLAYQAYLEWTPIRLPDQRGAAGTRFWRRFTYGDLADLSVLETRQNRSEQAADQAAVSDPSRHLPEPQQMRWLLDGLRAKRTWHLLGNQVVLAQLRVPATPDVAGPFRELLPALSTVPADGYVFNTDQWDGYAADQATLLAGMAAGRGDAVVLTGDIHSSWANDLPQAPGTYLPGVTLSAGVEFVCPSVSSDGFYEIAQRQRAGAIALAEAIQAGNRHVRFLDGIGHGYCVADVTPERVHVDYVWIASTTSPADPRLDRSATAAVGASWETVAGSRVVRAATTPMGARRDAPRLLPLAASTPAPVVHPQALPAAALPTTGAREALAATGLAALALTTALSCGARGPSGADRMT